MKKILALVVVLSTFYFGIGASGKSKPATGFDHSHKLWSEILKKNVTVLRGGKASSVNYKGIDKKVLATYVKSLLAVKKTQLNQWSREQKLAFYFNLYNSLTVQLVIDHLPLKSIRDVGSWYRPTWKKKFFSIFGNKANLDNIEHDWVRGDKQFSEPRVHFAFNCASIGCPALLNSAFTEKNLENQLQQAMVSFLSDETRNRYNIKTKSLLVSHIFKWYGDDFSKGWKGIKSLKGLFAAHAKLLSPDTKIQKLIREQKVKIEFEEYNWKLNDTK